jgi:hypothetical protein
MPKASGAPALPRGGSSTAPANPADEIVDAEIVGDADEFVSLEDAEEFVKALAQDLPSDQIKKVSSRLTALSNEKMKLEKEKKGGKKTKAAKTKTTLVASRAGAADTTVYDEGAFGE